VTHPWTRPLAWGLLATTMAALAVSAGYGVAAGDLMDAFAFAPVLLAFAGVGAIVASHRPANPIGWLFLAEGLGFALGLATDTYARYVTQAGATPTAVPWTDWLGAALGELGFLFPLALLLFPDGRLPSRRWRPVAWLLVAAEAMSVIMAATSGAALRAQSDAIQLSPVRLIPDSLADPVLNAIQTALIPLSVAAAAGCVVRYRRSPGPVRQQIKWIAYAGLVTAAGLVAFGLAFGNPLGAFLILGPLIPVAAGIAIFRYRLYDIDVVISKTIVYGSLAAFITVVYAIIVAGLGSLGSGSLAGSGSRPNPGLSILATAVVAVAFQPLRQRMQRVANRLVYGKRATPYEALSDFAGQVGGTYATDDVLPRMARILAEATGAARADVWLRAGSQLRAGASWPPGAPEPGPVALAGDGPPPDGDGPLPDGGALQAGDGRLTLVRHQGEVLGALSVTKRPGEQLTPAEDKLVGDLAGQVGLILRNVGLTEQLGERLAELRASRRRIVTAQDDQRRRIERDLRDGAQRQLVTIASGLARAESLAGRDEERERALVAQLRASARGALETLRDLARGIYPPLLADQGLAAAVSAHAGKAPLPVVVDTDGVGRYPADVETAVYFCCVEAVQNAARHAPGSTVRVRLHGSAGDLSFRVADDGPGFDRSAAPPGNGGGLQHMADRLAALGGSLQVDTRPGAGTTVTGQIPVTLVTAPLPGTVLSGPAGGAAASSAPPGSSVTAGTSTSLTGHGILR
jgi:signal transduction histidine kinase